MRKLDPDSLRERKKLRTREAIADAAFELFLARGFDNVTVAEVADAAEVSEKTVFNHFSCKEELVFDLGPALEDELIACVKDRPVGVAVIDALRGFGESADELRAEWERHMRLHGHRQVAWDARAEQGARRLRAAFEQREKVRDLVLEKLEALEQRGVGAAAEKLKRALQLEDPEAIAPSGARAAHEQVEGFRRIVRESPALLAYQRGTFARLEERLRDTLLEEIKPENLRGRIEAHVIAAGIVAVLRVQLDVGDGAPLLKPGGGSRVLGRGLRVLERGFAGWLPRKRR